MLDDQKRKEMIYPMVTGGHSQATADQMHEFDMRMAVKMAMAKKDIVRWGMPDDVAVQYRSEMSRLWRMTIVEETKHPPLPSRRSAYTLPEHIDERAQKRLDRLDSQLSAAGIALETRECILACQRIGLCKEQLVVDGRAALRDLAA